MLAKPGNTLDMCPTHKGDETSIEQGTMVFASLRKYCEMEVGQSGRTLVWKSTPLEVGSRRRYPEVRSASMDSRTAFVRIARWLSYSEDEANSLSTSLLTLMFLATICRIFRFGFGRRLFRRLGCCVTLSRCKRIVSLKLDWFSLREHLLK